MKTYYLYWESEYGLECFVCKAISIYEAKQEAKSLSQEIIDCLVDVVEVEQ